MGDRALSGLVGAIGLLTRVPVRLRGVHDPGAALVWFPVVGALVGVTGAVVYAGAGLVLPQLPAAAIAIATLVVITGALHEDGLADSVDAWGGGDGRDETLRILRDPAHGTYGILALVTSVVLRVAALASLSPAAALLALPVVHACSRAATVALLATTPSADTIGLGAQFARGTGAVRATVAVIAAVMLSASLVGLAAVAVVAIGVIMSVFVRRIARRRIGGVTGDVLGAAQQLVEVGGLVVLAAVDRTSGMG